MKYKDFKTMSNEEMKAVKGSTAPGGGGGQTHCVSGECSYYEAGTGEVTGTCQTNSNDACVCKGPKSSIITEDCDA